MHDRRDEVYDEHMPWEAENDPGNGPAESQESRRYLKLPPELVDGQSFEVVDPKNGGLSERLSEWADEAVEGETVELQWIEMTPREFGCLPDI